MGRHQGPSGHVYSHKALSRRASLFFYRLFESLMDRSITKYSTEDSQQPYVHLTHKCDTGEALGSDGVTVGQLGRSQAMSSCRLSVRLDTIPPEIFDEIISDCSPLELKALRQTCHRLASLAAPQLFRKVVVVPFEDSFKNLLSLAEHPRLASHVQRITYVAKTAGGILYNFEDFKVDVLRLPDAKGIRRVPYTDSLQLDWGYKVEDYTSKKLYRLYHAYNALCMKSVSENAKHVELVSLVPALRKLCNLRKFAVSGGHWIEQPRAILQALEKAGLYSSRFIRALDVNGRLESLLAAAKFAGRSIHELTILDLSEHKGTISQDFWTSMSSVVSDMHSLYLQAGSYNDEGLKSHLQLPFLLQQCSLVQYLELDLQRGMYSAPALVFKVLFARKPDSLAVQDLRLRNFSVTESDLVNGLSGMCQSLKSLVIDNVTLRPRPRRCKSKGQDSITEVDRGCWTQVLKALAHGLSLRHFSLDGHLRNASGGQFISTYNRRPFKLLSDRRRGRYLEVNRHMIDVVKRQNSVVLPQCYLPPENDCLRRRIEQFVTHGGSCPLESRKEDGVIPSSWLGDYSFRFDPSMQ